MSKPVLALTLGEPAGIGPEIIVKAWTALKDSGPAFVVIGDADSLAAASRNGRGDIRPVLADNCFHCHGPDPGTRKVGLRLDTEAGFFAKRLTKDGKEESRIIVENNVRYCRARSQLASP